jgi:hypothetical protein
MIASCHCRPPHRTLHPTTYIPRTNQPQTSSGMPMECDMYNKKGQFAFEQDGAYLGRRWWVRRCPRGSIPSRPHTPPTPPHKRHTIISLRHNRSNRTGYTAPYTPAWRSFIVVPYLFGLRAALWAVVPLVTPPITARIPRPARCE